MKHLQRHCLVFIIAFLSVFIGIFTPSHSPLRAGVARDDEIYELTVESWTMAKRRWRLEHDKDTRKSFHLYAGAPLPSFSNVVDDRTLLSPEYLAGQNLRMLAGPIRQAAEWNLEAKLQRDRRVRQRHERIAGVSEDTPQAVRVLVMAENRTEDDVGIDTSPRIAINVKGSTVEGFRYDAADEAEYDGDGALFAGDEVDFEVRRRVRKALREWRGKRAATGRFLSAEDAYEKEEEDDDDDDDGASAGERSTPEVPVSVSDGRLLPLRLQTAHLETDSARRVPALPAVVRRTNHEAGEVTRIDPSHFYAVGEKWLRHWEKKKLKKPFVFYELPRQRARRRPRFAWQKFYITVNLHKNVETIPFLTGALVAFLEDEIAPFFDLATSVVVTIYANASPDLTGPLIRSFMIPYLQKAGVENIYATVKGSCEGFIRRLDRLHERIEWMACLRNKALEPLQELGWHVFSAKEAMDLDEPSAIYSPHYDRQQERGPHLSAERLTSSGGGGLHNRTAYSRGREGHDAAVDVADDELVIVFLNDIYFRPQDLTLLLESVPEPVMAARAMPDGAHPLRDGEAAAPPDTGVDRGTSFDMACGMDFYYTFYDTWVSRDRHGQPFLPAMPYTDDTETRAAFGRILGAAATRDSRGGRGADDRPLPHAIPVKCCWNGVAALRGSYFLPPLMPRQPASSSENGLEGETAAAPGDDRGRDHGGGAFPRTFVRPSGAVYDRVDALETTSHAETSVAPGPSQSQLAHRVEQEGQRLRNSLTWQYLQLLALRLAADRRAWRSFQLSMAKKLALPPPPADALGGNGGNETIKALLWGLEQELLSLHQPQHPRDHGNEQSRERHTEERPRVTAALLEEVDFFAYVPIQVKRLVDALLLHSPPNASLSRADDAILLGRAGGEGGRAGRANAGGEPALDRGVHEGEPGSFTQWSLKQWEQLLQERRRGTDAPSPLTPSQVFSEKGNLFARDDGVLYRARHPVVRFRHAFTPSFGAFVASARALHSNASRDGAARARRGESASSIRGRGSPTSSASSGAGLGLSPFFPRVKLNVCQASECLLICQDIMHAAITQRGRAPVILMNPLVRVAYEAEHFFRVAAPPPAFATAGQRHEADPAADKPPPWSSLAWLYSSPRLFRLCGAVRDLRLAWHRLCGLLTFRFLSETSPSSARAAAEGQREETGEVVSAASSSQQRWLPVETTTSSADDWTLDNVHLMVTVRHDRPSAAAGEKAVGADGNEKGEWLLRLNVTQHTTMECFLPADDDSGAIVEPLMRLAYALLILGLLWYVITSANEQLAQKIAARQRQQGSCRGSAGATRVSGSARLEEEGWSPAADATPVAADNGNAWAEAKAGAAALTPEERLWLQVTRYVQQYCWRWCRSLVATQEKIVKLSDDDTSLPEAKGRELHRRRRFGQVVRSLLAKAFAILSCLTSRAKRGRAWMASTSSEALDTSDNEGIAVPVSSKPMARSPTAMSPTAAGIPNPSPVLERLRFRDSMTPVATSSKLV